VTGDRTAKSMLDSTAFACFVVAALGALYLGIARFALDAFPYSGDEYSAFLQAELFARGLLKAPAPAHAEWLRVDHVIIDDWVRSKYPPGASALLALGMRAGLAWIVTPLEAVLTLVLVWLTTRRLLGPRPALIGLVALGLAPLFAFQAASFFPHTPATLFLAVAFTALAAWSRHQRSGWLVVAGAAIGCAFLVRPMDAILFGLALCALRSPRVVAITAAAAIPFVVVNLVYQRAQFGSAFTDGYHVYEPTFRALYGSAGAHPIVLSRLWDPVQQWNHLDLYRALIVDWTVAGTALVAIFGAFAIGREHPAWRMRTVSVALIATYTIALLPMISDPDDGARPRYLSPILIPLCFLAAEGFAPACAALAARFGRRIQIAVVAAAIVFAPVQLGAFLVSRIPQVWKREGLFRVVEAAHVRDAVVVVRAKYPSRHARNGPFFDRSVLYLSAPPTAGVDVVAAAYPGRAVWEAREGEPWTLARVR
jgi:4-amino-4-deoxy-L-arabinose transferase-like glycosyltransferase